MMKKFIFTTILFVCVNWNASAQNFVFSTPQQIEEVIYDAAYHVYNINFKTNRPQEIVYKWEKLENSLNPFWNYSLCDYTGCYVGAPDNGTMTTITVEESEAGKEGFFTLTINTGEITGDGSLVLYVYDSNNPNIGDTVSFHVTRSISTGLKEEIKAMVEPMIFPNPSTDQFNISLSDLTEISHVGIYNAIGKLVSNLNHVKQTKLTIDVSAFETGIYFVNVTSTQGGLYTKKLIIR
jgi:hypothetical protein